MRIGLDQIRAVRAAERRKRKRRIALLVIALAAIAVLRLCIQMRGYPPDSPFYVFKMLGMWLWGLISGIFRGREAAVEWLRGQVGLFYAPVVAKLRRVIIVAVAGAILALSGTVYQTSMRNPMAVPTMLGVSSGVNLAQMAMVVLFANQAYSMARERYVLSYGLSIGVIFIILGCAKLVGRKGFSIPDMLIVGVIVNRFIQVVMDYMQTNMDLTTFELYEDYAQNSLNYFDSFSDIKVLVIVSLIVVVPLVLMRFAFNVVSFEDEEAYSVGVKATAMRLYGIIAGGVLTATAMIHAGNIGMLATVVPLMCRYLYGADFRDLLWSSAMWGSIILIGADIICAYTYINEFFIPLGNIISFLAVPLLIWIIRKNTAIFSSMERQ